jgi:hypothetical protein
MKKKIWLSALDEPCPEWWKTTGPYNEILSGLGENYGEEKSGN